MRVLEFSQFGEPATVLSVQQRPEPELQPGQVRVRLLASPVNPSDLMTIRGIYGKRPALPAVPGYEGVGIVEEARAGLFGQFLKGKRVAVLNSVSGNWQEQVCVPAKSVIPLSARLPLEQAAVFFINPATAWLMTRKVLAVPRGGWLLQSAAGSAVGKMVIRLGRQHGFHTINIVRRQEQVEELRSIGADAVVVFDPATEPAETLLNRVKELAGSDGVGWAVDPVGGPVGSAMVPCLGSGGRMLVYGTLSSEPLQFSSRALMTHGSRIEGFWLSNVMATMPLFSKLSLISQLTSGILSGTLAAEIGGSYPLESFREALAAAEQPGKAGKVLFRIGAA